MTLRQALWFSQMGCETIFIVDLTILIHQWSIFWDSWSLFQTLSVDWELWRHATLGHISPLSFLFSLAFRATISFQFGVQCHHLFLVWHSELSVYSMAFRATIPSQLRHSEPPSLLSYDIQNRPYQFWHSEPPNLFSLVFRASIPS